MTFIPWQYGTDRCLEAIASTKRLIVYVYILLQIIYRTRLIELAIEKPVSTIFTAIAEP